MSSGWSIVRDPAIAGARLAVWQQGRVVDGVQRPAVSVELHLSEKDLERIVEGLTTTLHHDDLRIVIRSEKDTSSGRAGEEKP